MVKEAKKNKKVYEFALKGIRYLYKESRVSKPRVKKQIIDVEMPVIFEEQQCDLDFNKIPLICSDVNYSSFLIENTPETSIETDDDSDVEIIE